MKMPKDRSARSSGGKIDNLSNEFFD